jgi:two-component system sensor histidine kinase UhpB
MTLRTTLIVWIGLVLLASLLFGSALIYWHAVRKVNVEMHAALEVGQRTVHNAIDEVEGAPDPVQRLRLLVTDLDGDRHLRATLIGTDGSILARSTPLRPDGSTPQWFFDLLRAPSQTARTQLPSGALLLESDPRNEIGEVWSDAMLTLTVLASFCSLIAILVFWSTGAALSPLRETLHAFGRIGIGDYSLRLPDRGPWELRQLSRGFNDMAGRLIDMQSRQQRLEEQLETLQEEERSDLAQDLHDEVGPLLFAISVDLAALERTPTVQNDPETASRLLATQDAIRQIQQHVKSVLARLRPPTVADLGLAHSIQGLVNFWRTRYPTVTFLVATTEDTVGTDIGSTIYRIVQESLSNALRHGQPSTIDIRIAIEAGEAISVHVIDDGKGLQAQDPAGGLGLRGMRNRVESSGGSLSIRTARHGRGVEVSARLPLTGQQA